MLFRSLLEEVHTLVARHRDITAALIAALAELDSRKLYRAEGFPSLYRYCIEHLHLSEFEAYNRIEAARIARRFPVVLNLLAAGDLTMSTVNVLGEVLTDENHQAVLAAARHKSKREVEAQLGVLRPLPDRPSVLMPLGEDRWRLQITLSAESHQALQRLRELTRQTIPDGDPARIVARALALLLTTVERRRLAAARRPRATALRVSDTRYVPAAVVRAVWKRDEDQCAFVGTLGRCPEREFLELHHKDPFSEGGPTSVDNLELRCRSHNTHEWEQHTRAG